MPILPQTAIEHKSHNSVACERSRVQWNGGNAGCGWIVGGSSKAASETARIVPLNIIGCSQVQHTHVQW